MNLSGAHLLLTYQCTFECDHCFVWGSPFQNGVMTLASIRQILKQAKDAGAIRSVYFEGGEPFLYFSTLLKAVQETAAMGFTVGIVSNAFWATSQEDAMEALGPFSGLVQDLTVSSDLFHYSESTSRQVSNACWAARELGIPLGVISIARPESSCSATSTGQIADGESRVMYRGRAVEKLASQAPKHPWKQFTDCPYENLRDPGRVHIDPFGNVHLCQGISIGNVFDTSLHEIARTFDPDSHPIVGPLLAGGPVELVRRYALDHEEAYADACHLCYQARRSLRPQFTGSLAPDSMYGIY